MLARQTLFLLHRLPSSPKALSPNSHSTAKWSLRRAPIRLSFNTIFYHTYIHPSPDKEPVGCLHHQVWVTGLLENCFLPSSDWLGSHHPPKGLSQESWAHQPVAPFGYLWLSDKGSPGEYVLLWCMPVHHVGHLLV